MRHINILQVNIDRSSAATDHLVKYVHDNNIHIILIQEPYAKHTRFPSRFRIFTVGIATAVVVTNSSVVASLVPEMSNEFTTSVLIEYGRHKVILNSTYFTPAGDITAQCNSLQQIVDLNTSYPLIISIDSNARSPVWGDRLQNRRGDIFLDFMATHGFIFHNTNREPTFSGHQGESFIDLTVSTISAARYIKNWELSQDDSLSQHRYIRYQLNFDFNQTPLFIEEHSLHRYNTSKANWDSFHQDYIDGICDLMEQIRYGFDINSIVCQFTDLIKHCCHRNIPIRTKKKHSVPWWTPALTSSRRLVNTLRRRFQSCRNPAYRDSLRREYVFAKRAYQKEIRNSKS